MRINRYIILTIIPILLSCFSPIDIEAENKNQYQEIIDSIHYYINNSLKTKEFPGAQVIAMKDGKVIIDSCYGYTNYTDSNRVTFNTIYDIASLTKCMGTTIALMKLYEDSLFNDSLNVEDYLPKYKSTPIGKIPILRLLTHSSGIISSLSLQYKLVYADGKGANVNNWFKGVLDDRRNSFYTKLFSSSYRERLYVYKNLKWDNRYLSTAKSATFPIKIADSIYISPDFYDNILDSALYSSKKYNTGRQMYSDINFYLIREVVEKISEKKIDDFLYTNIYNKMMLSNIGYTPIERGFDKDAIAPTENDVVLRNQMLQGYVHDEFAAICGGVGGNAGIFTNARDLYPICMEMMDSTDGFFTAKTKNHFLSQPYKGEKNFRALGFQRQDSTQFLRRTSFGHSGFTGCLFQVDPTKKILLIFLSNSVHPSRVNIKSPKDRSSYQIWRLLNKE